MTAEQTSAVEPAAAAESFVETPEKDGKAKRRARGAGRAKRWMQGRVLGVVLALLLVASAALAGSLLYLQYRPDRATDSSAAKAATAAASDGTVAILSYTPDTLDRDLTAAKSHLTGDFLSYYTKFTEQIVAPAAKQKAVKANAVVVRAAVSELHPSTAVVLVFVNQSTMSADRPEPTLTSSSVLVSLTKADGRWLISSFNPV